MLMMMMLYGLVLLQLLFCFASLAKRWEERVNSKIRLLLLSASFFLSTLIVPFSNLLVPDPLGRYPLRAREDLAASCCVFCFFYFVGWKFGMGEKERESERR